MCASSGTAAADRREPATEGDLTILMCCRVLLSLPRGDAASAMSRNFAIFTGLPEPHRLSDSAIANQLRFMQAQPWILEDSLSAESSASETQRTPEPELSSTFPVVVWVRIVKKGLSNPAHIITICLRLCFWTTWIKLYHHPFNFVMFLQNNKDSSSSLNSSLNDYVSEQ
jgi:hypothetical protein